jgi:UDP-GlcNAc:undecaprenyl-phosphate/decaprenyl-phosphate GlcNAc-1-phosphate transferase
VTARDTAPLLLSAALAAALAPGAMKALPRRPNFRGEQLPFPLGVVAALAGIGTLGAMALWDRVTGQDDFLVLFGALDRVGAELSALTSHAAVPYAALFLGVAFLGLLDDLLEAQGRGWRGHGREVLRGGFSTGVFKALGTLALAAAVVPAPSVGRWILGTLVVALTTNLFNILDLRPGRAWKVFLVAGIALVAVQEIEVLRIVGPFAGALIVLGALDLRERCMLGDTGANVMGAIVGVLLLGLEWEAQLVALAIVLGITIFGEFASITATIDKLPPLRFLDSLGRKRRP